MRKRQTKTAITGDERGFASIVVALIMIIVLALTTVGFAQLARREQQTSLDKQLASQAYYASESGINDAFQAIKAGTLPNSPDNCIGAPLTHKTISAPNDVAYTCVLADLRPDTLVYNTGSGITKVFSFEPVDSGGGAVTFDKLTVRWNTQGATATPTDGDASSNTFLPSNDWTNVKHYPSVIQLSITPYTAASDRNALIDNTYTAVFYPVGNNPTSSVYTTDPGQQGKLSTGTCDLNNSEPSKRYCESSITGIPQAPGAHYLVRFTNIYGASNVTITGSGGGTPIHFADAQAVIDSTGKAKDVLKRLQVHVPLNAQPDLPDYALDAQNICKRIQTEPAKTTFDGLSPSCTLDN